MTFSQMSCPLTFSVLMLTWQHEWVYLVPWHSPCASVSGQNQVVLSVGLWLVRGLSKHSNIVHNAWTTHWQVCCGFVGRLLLPRDPSCSQRPGVHGPDLRNLPGPLQTQEVCPQRACLQNEGVPLPAEGIVWVMVTTLTAALTVRMVFMWIMVTTLLLLLCKWYLCEWWSWLWPLLWLCEWYLCE